MSSLKNETSETISQYCIDTLNNLKIPLKKCIAFCTDNANTNFGGIHRKGQNNIFFKLKEAIQNKVLAALLTYCTILFLQLQIRLVLMLK